MAAFRVLEVANSSEESNYPWKIKIRFVASLIDEIQYFNWNIWLFGIPEQTYYSRGRQTAMLNQTTELVSWNCDGQGHVFMGCSKPKKFFVNKWGPKNVIYKTCRRCNKNIDTNKVITYCSWIWIKIHENGFSGALQMASSDYQNETEIEDYITTAEKCWCQCNYGYLPLLLNYWGQSKSAKS